MKKRGVKIPLEAPPGPPTDPLLFIAMLILCAALTWLVANWSAVHAWLERLFFGT